ncbi:hypothetical protein A2J03_09840 [Rhodococcus sp. EPR-157]|uniref:VG15 protein n=1 Tax=Rhodococcus sp. EPR-157 TaxID=1813677 RepID=UPI0007BBA91D|nr:ADP-ribosyltransferase [Rhodococcus sp. EPR-157]KZF00877.1 hypothetical protein A2J03_09840 [Rhodococcus sp. EPR-157]
MTPDEQRSVLDDLNLSATQNISELWRNASMMDLDSSQFRNVMIQDVPQIIEAYAAGAADLATVWYEDAAPGLLRYWPMPAAPAPTEQLEASTSWALRANGEAALTRIAGFTSRAIFGSARRTIVENAEKEPGAAWARHAQAGSCAFCRMLATRAEVYASKESATVLGVYQRGRGTRGASEKYHDHCRCTAVPVRPGQVYTPPDYAEQWDEQYKEAVRATSGGGRIDVNAVLAKMDELEHGTAATTVSKTAVSVTKAPRPGVAAAAANPVSDKPWHKTAAKFTEDEGRRHGSEIWDSYARGLDNGAVETVRTYTGRGYQVTNPGLRSRTTFGDTEAGSMRAVDAIRGLDTAVENAPRVTMPITVARDVDARVFGIVDAETDLTALVGRQFRDEAHLSTTLQSKLILPIGADQVELRLDVPADTKALYVSSFSRGERGLAAYGPDENELILGRGLDYEIYDAFMEGSDNRRILLARLIAQDATPREVQ